MNIQGYQKMTLLDYPGRVACTVFTGGCNLRCPFCHNAGLVSTPVAQPNAIDEVLAYLSRRQNILDGVCITGGEPLLQPDLTDFIRRLKDMGFAVKLDTNGSLPHRLQAVLDTGLVDYVAMDIKSSPAGYSRTIGCEMDIEAFASSVRLLKEGRVPFELRTTAVKGIHTPADFAAIGRWIGGQNPPAYFIQRFVDSGNLLGEGCAAFSDSEMDELADAVRQYVPSVQIRG